MPFRKNIKKILSVFILTATVIGFVAFSGMAADDAHASVAEGRNILQTLFTTEEGQLSFTRFEGQLAELTTDGYAEALVRTTDFREFVLTVVNFALGFLGLFAVLIVIYGGILYVAAAGEEERTQKGKKAITYAVIGLLIVLGSFAFVNTIIRGAVGETEKRRFVTGTTTAAGFNSMAEEVSELARGIYEEYVPVMEAHEALESIQAQASRDALDYGTAGPFNQVQRADVLAFLHGTRQTLQSLRSSFHSLSGAYAAINAEIREINNHIDTIRRYPEVRVGLKSREDGTWGLEESNGSLHTCSDWTEVLVDDWVNCVRYPVQLHAKWGGDLRDYYVGDELRRKIMVPAKEDFEDHVWWTLSRLERIHAELANLDLDTGTGGEVGRAYESTMDSFIGVRGAQAISTAISTETEGGGFLRAFDSGNPEFEVVDISRALLSALENQLAYAEALSQIQQVQARLRANVVSGNAPLTVTFDVGGTIDPDGGSILPGNIEWNLDGGAERGAVTCRGVTVGARGEIEVTEEGVGDTTFRQCTYNHPGTYAATATVKSNDPSRYVSGSSTLMIRVDPPINLIDLELGVNDKTIPVMRYSERGVLIISNDYIPVTLSEAQRGISFDASGTRNVQSCDWDFGVRGGSVFNDCNPTFEFDSRGRYNVELTVTNVLGETSKKRFILDVRDLAARIAASPRENVFIGDSVRLDAGQSSGEGIRAYEWSIFDAEGELLDLGADRNSRSFNYRFEEPGRYQINLMVVSDLDRASAQPFFLSVSSRPPIASFDYDIPDSTQPGTVQLNGGSSYNPDGTEEDLIYEWTISPGGNGGETWEIVNDTTLMDIAPEIKFKEKGDYEVNLKVSDARTIGVEGLEEEYGEVKKTITIDNTLDVAWDDNFPYMGILDEEGQAVVDFGLISDNAIEYEIDFGDGEQLSAPMHEPISHTYTTAGRFDVVAIVYDEDYTENTIRRRVHIGAADSPMAKIGVSVNNVEIYDFTRPITVSKIDNLRFDASMSVNTDGTATNLNYSWDFGDRNRSSSRIAHHTYRELSPPEEGYYTATLRVIDRNDPSKYDESEVYINVVNLPPTFANVQGIPEFRLIGALRTPVDVRVRAFGAEDPDGQITQYRWWYFDVNNPEEQMGMQITTAPTATLKIGTKGREGEEMEYGFGLEVTDNDNLTYSNEEDIMMGNYHSITVVNGPNLPPVAGFEVDRTSVYVGDPVNFVSTSTDPDGEIVGYYWDFDGDGFHNVERTTQSNVTHVYTKRNMDGYNVRLKVVDDAAAEAVSDVRTIYVDSHAEPPIASFQIEPAVEEGRLAVQFVDTSTPDEEAGAEIIDYRWDFDIDYDSTGDGIPDNDINSRESDPIWNFPGRGNYRVKLTITDNQGNVSETIQTVRVPLAAPPEADFSYEVMDGRVHFRDLSTSDLESGAAIVRHTWDFDVDNPATEDSTLREPIHTYLESGTYNVELTVRDSHGNEDSIIKEVDFRLPDPITRPDVPIIPPEPVTDLRAVLTTTPSPDADGIIYLEGDSGRVTFDFTGSEGDIEYYIFDKNIHRDSTGDGIPDNDEDYRIGLPGRWTTNFKKTDEPIEVRFTVRDERGNEHSITQQIKFK